MVHNVLGGKWSPLPAQTVQSVLKRVLVGSVYDSCSPGLSISQQVWTRFSGPTHSLKWFWQVKTALGDPWARLAMKASNQEDYICVLDEENWKLLCRICGFMHCLYYRCSWSESSAFQIPRQITKCLSDPSWVLRLVLIDKWKELNQSDQVVNLDSSDWSEWSHVTCAWPAGGDPVETGFVCNL